MNKSRLLIASMGLVFAAGCSHASKRAQNNPPPAPTAQQQAVSQLGTDRDAYVADTQKRIDEMQKFADELRNQSVTAEKPRKKKLENAADDMESSLKDVKKDLAEVKQSAPENWLDYKRDVTKSMQRAEVQYSDSVHLVR